MVANLYVKHHVNDVHACVGTVKGSAIIKTSRRYVFTQCHAVRRSESLKCKYTVLYTCVYWRSTLA